MGAKARAAAAAAAEEKKIQEGYNAKTATPTFNPNMQVPQNTWTYDANGNPQFVVPGFLNSAPPTPSGSIGDYISKLTGVTPSTANPAFDKLHNEFKHGKRTPLDSLWEMLGQSSAGKPMSPDNTAAMMQNNAHHLARLNAIAPGAHPLGYGSDPVPADGASANLHGWNNQIPMGFFFGKGRMS